MKFKIDENLPVEVAELFEKHGHDALTVFQEQLVGATDSHIAAVCQSEKRTLVTLDTDFCDIRTDLVTLKIFQFQNCMGMQPLQARKPCFETELDSLNFYALNNIR